MTREQAKSLDRRIRVYVAGPLTVGVVGHNIRKAVLVADELLNQGFAPYVPHLNHLWDMIKPHSYEDWLSLDFEYLKTCDIMYRIPGTSRGADREAALAKGYDITVYYDLENLYEDLLSIEANEERKEYS